MNITPVNQNNQNNKSFGMLSTRLLKLALIRAADDPEQLARVQQLAARAFENKNVHVGIKTSDNWPDDSRLRFFGIHLFDNFRNQYNIPSKNLQGNFSPDNVDFFQKIDDAVEQAEKIVEGMSPTEKLRNQLITQSTNITLKDGTIF